MKFARENASDLFDKRAKVLPDRTSPSFVVLIGLRDLSLSLSRFLAIRRRVSLGARARGRKENRRDKA